MGRCNYVPCSAYVVGSVVLIMQGLDTIIKDETLVRHSFIAPCACVFLFAACCLLTLSKTCVLQRKPTAVNKPIQNLYDSDLEYDGDEEVQETAFVEVLRHQMIPEMLKNFMEFCYSRPIYIFATVLGVIPLIVLATVYRYELTGNENRFVATLATAALVNAFGIINVSKQRTPEVREPKIRYQPFDEFIEIPMKVVISKMFAGLQFNGVAQVIFRMFYQLAAVYGMIAVCNMPDEEIARFQERSGMGKIYWYIFTIMVFANVCGIFLLLETFLLAFFIAEERLLCTFERNWERNLRAFDYLLSDTPAEIESLEQLRAAYLEKCEDTLLSDENKAVQYIERPLWRRKRAFVDRPGGSPVRVRLVPNVESDSSEEDDSEQDDSEQGGGAVAGPSNVPPPEQQKYPEELEYKSKLRNWSRRVF